ncbi:MAG: peptidoglycan-binding protein [Ilumatobacteraceae bacterium]
MTLSIRMRRPRAPGSPVRSTLALAVAALATLTTVVGTGGTAHADTTIYFDDAGAAPTISLIGDSTLSGVRWYDEYGDLERYNFVFDAESCRRTVERSCWSREDIRAETALVTMQRLSGQLGEVMVVMSGYNDPGYSFASSVDTIIAEAKRQGIPQVIWLTLRTTKVSYEEPTHLANANVYREDNRILYEKAEEHGDYLQIADWSTYAADESGWFEYDGVHLTADGVDAVTTYIADRVDEALAGERLTAEYPAWVLLESGDSGEVVVSAQEALIEEGVSIDGGADGVYGAATAAAVESFQRDNELDVTGTIDDATAAVLGVYTPDPATLTVEPATVTTQPAAEPATVASEPATVASEPAAVASEPATVASEPATVASEPAAGASEPAAGAAPLAGETAQDPPTPVAANDAALGGEDDDGGGLPRSVIVPLLAVGALALAVFLRRRQVVARRARARRRSSGARRPFTV